MLALVLVPTTFAVATLSSPLAGVDPNTLKCGPSGQGYLNLPHYTDCSKFYMCAHGNEVEQSCPPGTIYDFEIQVCNHPWATKCVLRNKNETSTSEPTTTTTQGPTTSGPTATTQVTTPEPAATVPKETTTVPQHTTAVPEQTIVPEQTTVPEQTATVPEQTTAVPEQTTVPEETTSVPEQTITVPEETTAIPEETTVPEETTTVAEETTTAPDETTTPGPTTTPQESTSEPSTSTEPITTSTEPGQTGPTTENSTNAPVTTSESTEGSSTEPESITTEAVNPSELSCDPSGQIFLLLPHHTNCSKFYMCDHGQEVEFSCPEGTIFDFKLQGCNWPSATKCWLRDDVHTTEAVSTTTDIEGSGDEGVTGSTAPPDGGSDELEGEFIVYA